MKHLFKATQLGWEGKKEGIWFDTDFYSKKEAKAQFKPYKGVNQKGYEYTGYEFDGQKYYDVQYLGKFEDDKLPRNDDDLWSLRFNKKKR